MRPGGAAAQGQDRVIDREGLVGADAEFAADIGDVSGAVVERKGAGAGNRAFGIGR